MKHLNTNTHQDYTVAIFIHLNVRLYIIMYLQPYKYEMRSEYLRDIIQKKNTTSVFLLQMIKLTDALSNVLSPTPIAKTGRP